MTDQEQLNIAVLGAGVIGLQNALTLLTDSNFNPRPRVTVVADAFPGTLAPNYTSQFAGGQWRTHAQPTSASGSEEGGWDIQTYEYWKQLVISEHPRGINDGSQTKVHKKSGVGMLKSRVMWDEITTEIQPVHANGELGGGLWWRDKVDDFRVLSDNERASGTIHGVEWTSFCVDVPQYLQFLADQVKEKGANFIKAKLPVDGGLEKALITVEEVAGSIDCFVNATGLGAKFLCSDDKMFPVRGQTVLVNGEASAARTRFGNGYISYTIPRPGSGTTILGGVNERGSWNETVDEALHLKILERAQLLAPELVKQDGKLEIVSRQVGFRPGREGGPRVEIEEVGHRLVIHCYGHGGAGYMNSVGTSSKVARLLWDFVASH